MYRFREPPHASSMPAQPAAQPALEPASQPVSQAGNGLEAEPASTPFRFAMLSDTGRVRKGNEDAVGASAQHGVFVLCDGMGGAAAGEVASRLAVETLLAHIASAPHPDASATAPSAPLDPSATNPPPPHRQRSANPPSPRRSSSDLRLEAAIHAANQAVYTRSRRDPSLRGMGTTLAALLLDAPDSAHPSQPPSLILAHVGDSRCYLFRDGRLDALTQDHSLVEEQLRSGQITASEAQHHPMRNIITRAVGSQPAVEPEIRRLDPRPGDLFLLASDGLTRDLTDTDLQAIFAQTLRAAARPSAHPLDLHHLCQTLIDGANRAGGGDNITVLLLQLCS